MLIYFKFLDSKNHKNNEFNDDSLGCSALEIEQINSSPILSSGSRYSSLDKRNGSPLASSTIVPGKKSKHNELSKEKDCNVEKNKGKEVTENLAPSDAQESEIFYENLDNDESSVISKSALDFDVKNLHFININIENLLSLHKINNFKNKSYDEEPAQTFLDFYPYFCKFKNKVIFFFSYY